MGYVYFCNNPRGKCHIGDCVIRAISKAMGTSWENTYIDLVMEGYDMCDMPSSNAVWGKYLHSKRFHETLIPDIHTVSDFCEMHPVGKYILSTGSHVVCAEDGDYFDTWDSGDEIIRSFWEREERE